MDVEPCEKGEVAGDDDEAKSPSSGGRRDCDAAVGASGMGCAFSGKIERMGRAASV